MVRTQIQLTDKQAKEIKRIAAVRGVSMAKIIREAIEETMKSGRGSSSEEKRSRALEALGKFRSGNKDISKRHDAYLADAFKE